MNKNPKAKNFMPLRKMKIVNKSDKFEMISYFQSKMDEFCHNSPIDNVNLISIIDAEEIKKASKWRARLPNEKTVAPVQHLIHYFC